MSKKNETILLTHYTMIYQIVDFLKSYQRKTGFRHHDTTQCLTMTSGSIYHHNVQNKI